MFDASMIGAGLGAIPTLWKLLMGKTGNDNAGALSASAGGITSPMAAMTPIQAGSDAAIGPDGIRNPISGPEQPGARLDNLGNPLTPGIMQPISAGYQNPLPSPESLASGDASGIGGLGSALGGLGKALGGSGPTSSPGGAPYQPPAAPTPQGGGGPSPGMTASQNGGMGMNPLFLSFLRARLANAGGGVLGGLG